MQWRSSWGEGWYARGIQHLYAFLHGVNPTCCHRVLASGGHGADRSVWNAPTEFWAPDQAPMGLSREFWGQEKLLIPTKLNSGVKG